jgi:hypothetical protein
MAQTPVRVTHSLESVMVWRKRTTGRSLLFVVVEVLLRVVERLMGHELAQDHELRAGVLPAQAWLLRCSG